MCGRDGASRNRCTRTAPPWLIIHLDDLCIIALALCGDHLSIIPTKSGVQHCTGSSLDIIIIATSMSAVVVKISPRPSNLTISYVKLTLTYVLKK